MDIAQVKQTILKEKLVVLFRNVPNEKMGEVAKALVRGGVKLLELTFDQKSNDPNGDFKRAVAEVKNAVGETLLLGAGTVLTPEQVEAACEAGARYIISPCTKESVVKRTKELGMLSIPGALTPTEIVAAWDMGADMVKVFPADDMGLHYLWNLRGPLPHIPIMATGGVNPQTIPQFFANGVNAVGTGITVINRDMLAASDYAGIEALAREHVEVIAGLSKKTE